MSPHEMRKRAVNAVQKGMHVNDVAKAYHKNCSSFTAGSAEHSQPLLNEGLMRHFTTHRTVPVQSVSMR